MGCWTRAGGDPVGIFLMPNKTHELADVAFPKRDSNQNNCVLLFATFELAKLFARFKILILDLLMQNTPTIMLVQHCPSTFQLQWVGEWLGAPCYIRRGGGRIEHTLGCLNF